MSSKVSIIVPIFGVENYIAQCAHSLFRQTFKDIEYIFVDDCTKDNSISILESIIEEYPYRKEHISIIRKDKNEGLPTARKTGFERATGEYIIHIDSDDWVEYDMIEKMYNKAISDNLDIVWCDYYEEYPDHTKHINTYSDSMDKISIFKRLLSLNNNLHSGVWNKLVKRDIYLSNNVFFPKANQWEDFVLTIQNIYYSERIGHLNSALYHYRFNSNSLTRDDKREIKRINEMYENLFIVTRFLQDKLGKDIVALEPQLSDYTNSFKIALMLIKETRNINKLNELNRYSNKFIFNRSLKVQYYHKVLLYLATKNILLLYYIWDIAYTCKTKLIGH